MKIRFWAQLFLCLLLLLPVGAAVEGCSGGSSGGGGGGSTPPPNTQQTVHQSLNSNLSNVRTDGSFQSSQSSQLVTGVSDGTTTLNGDLLVSINGNVFQNGGVSTVLVSSGQTIRVYEDGNPSNDVDYRQP